MKSKIAKVVLSLILMVSSMCIAGMSFAMSERDSKSQDRQRVESRINRDVSSQGSYINELGYALPSDRASRPTNNTDASRQFEKEHRGRVGIK